MDFRLRQTPAGVVAWLHQLSWCQYMYIKSSEVCSKGPYSLLKWRRALGVTGVEVSTSISRPFKPSLQTSAATSWLISLTWSNSNTCRRMQFRAVVGWRWGSGSKIMFKCPDSVIVSFFITIFLLLLVTKKPRGGEMTDNIVGDEMSQREKSWTQYLI